MIELNLLPDVKKEFIRAQRTRNQVVAMSLIAIVASVGLIIIFAFSVYGGQKLVMNNLTNDIKDKSAELQSVEDLDKYLTVQNQLGQIEGLHDNKELYSRLMDYLVVLNPVAPNSVQLDTLEIISQESTIVLKGLAPSSQAFNVFKDTLVNAQLVYTSGDENVESDLFSDVVVESGSLGRVSDQTMFTFIVRVTYDENAFLTSTTNASVRVPNMETTQSFRQAPLFNSAANRNEEAQ